MNPLAYLLYCAKRARARIRTVEAVMIVNTEHTYQRNVVRANFFNACSFGRAVTRATVGARRVVLDAMYMYVHTRRLDNEIC